MSSGVEYERGVIGWIARLAAWAFNLYMVYWLLRYLAHANDGLQHVSRDVAGLAIGVGLLTVLAQWAAGAALLHLLVRATRWPKRTSEGRG